MMGALNDPAPPPLSMDSLEDLQDYLQKVHRVTIDDGDPILMVYTLHKVALGDLQRLLDQHGRALSDRVDRITHDLEEDIRRALADLKDEALRDAVRERLATLGEAGRLVETTLKRQRGTLRTQIVLTVLNYLALACALGVLATVAL